MIELKYGLDERERNFCIVTLTKHFTVLTNQTEFLGFRYSKKKKGSYESMNHLCRVLEQTVYPETELLYVTI